MRDIEGNGSFVEIITSNTETEVVGVEQDDDGARLELAQEVREIIKKALFETLLEELITNNPQETVDLIKKIDNVKNGIDQVGLQLYCPHEIR